MNDPHVEALHYTVVHADHVDYEKAPALSHDEGEFSVRIENDRAEVTMKSHYVTADSSRSVVEPFLRAWELAAALQTGPGELEFKYDRATIIDRNPSQAAVLHTEAGIFFASLTATATGHVGRMKYPDAPKKIARDAAVDLMFERFCRYRAGSTSLADAANFCLTVLEFYSDGRSRSAAAKRYGVAKTVLNKLGELAASKGGNEARKAGGAGLPFATVERHWLEETVKRLITRAGEVAYDPSAVNPQISLSDFPAL